MLELEQVSKVFPGSRRGFTRGAPVQALKDVSLSIERGESFGLVGESGSGKTTLTRCILQLDMPTGGRILFEGEDLAKLSPAALRQLRARIQIVFQDPMASLNPRMSIHDIVAELLTLVGLGPQHLYRYPHEFSGGQRQRIGIARALATHPALLLLDEPTSALDVSVQAQVLNLLQDLQSRLDLTYLFISHDLAVIRYVCDRVALINHGVLVEQGTRDQIFDAPGHDYTRQLLAAMPEVTVD